MKVKLYKKFVSRACDILKMSRTQLFNRKYRDCVIPCYKYGIYAKKLYKDSSILYLLTNHHPLSQVWKALDFKTKWLVAYWKHSHWKHFIQVKLDLGEDLYEILAGILNIMEKA